MEIEWFGITQSLSGSSRSCHRDHRPPFKAIRSIASRTGAIQSSHLSQCLPLSKLRTRRKFLRFSRLFFSFFSIFSSIFSSIFFLDFCPASPRVCEATIPEFIRNVYEFVVKGLTVLVKELVTSFAAVPGKKRDYKVQSCPGILVALTRLNYQTE